MGILEDITVLAVVKAAAGSACAKVLADFGARVILVEPPDGHPVRKLNYNEMYNGKMKSVPVNLRREKARELLHRILAGADVFVSNYRPDALKAMGLDYDHLKEQYPRLIHGTITGFGEKGRMRQTPGFDVTAFWARSGLLHDFASKEGEPGATPPGLGDIECGKSLAMGVIAALYDRERRGRGQKVTASLYAEGLYANHTAIIDWQYGLSYPASSPQESGRVKNTFRCRDGYLRTMSLNWERDLPGYFRIIGMEYSADMQKAAVSLEQESSVKRISDTLEQGFLSMGVQEAMDGLDREGLAGSIVYPGSFPARDPQARENGFLVDVEDKDGRWIKIPALPVQLEHNRYTAGARAHDFGEDSREVLLEYGYTQEEAREMLSDGTVFGADV